MSLDIHNQNKSFICKAILPQDAPEATNKLSFLFQALNHSPIRPLSNSEKALKHLQDLFNHPENQLLSHSLIPTTPPRPFDAGLTPRLFALIHGDTYIKGTSFEGGNTQDNVNFLLEYLKSLKVKAVIAQDLLTALISLFENFCFAATESPQSLAEKVKALKPGTSLFIEGGWIGQGIAPGHTLIYEFTKLKSGSYDIYVYNTGSGTAAYHAFLQTPQKNLISPVVKYHNVLPAEIGICSTGKIYTGFFDFLLNLQKDNEKKWDAEKIYEKLFGHLEHKKTTATHLRADFLTAQRSGTCSWRVLMALLHTRIPDFNTYKRFKFFLDQDTLISFFKSQQSSLHEEETRYLLQKAVEKLHRRIHKVYPLLSEKEALNAYGTGKEILRALEQTAKFSSAPKQGPLYLTNRMTKNTPPSLNTLYLPELRTYTDIEQHPLPLEIHSIEPLNFLNTLNAMATHLTAYHQAEPTVIYQIESFVEALPLNAADFWKTIPEQDLGKSIASIAHIFTTYSKACSHLNLYLPVEQNTAYALLIVAHQLALRLDAPYGNLLSNHALFFKPYEECDVDPYFLCYKTSDWSYRKEILHYLKTLNKNNPPVLFDFPSLREISTTEVPSLISFWESAAKRDPSLEKDFRDEASALQRSDRDQYGTVELDLIYKGLLLREKSKFKDIKETAHLFFLQEIAYNVLIFMGFNKYYYYDSNWNIRLDRGGSNTIDIRHDIRDTLYNEDDPTKLAVFPAEKHFPPLKNVDKFIQNTPIFERRLTQIQPENTLFDIGWQPPQNVPCPLLLARAHCAPSLTPQETLLYFRHHLRELETPEAQALFNLLFFKGMQGEDFILQAELKKGAFVKQCELFIKESLDLFFRLQPEKRAKTYVVCFISKFILRLKQIDPQAPLPSLHPDINEWLQNPHLSDFEKGYIHLHRCMQYAYKNPKTLTNEELKEAVSSWFFYLNHPLDPKWKDPFLQAECSRFGHHLAQLLPHLNSPDLNSLLNHTLNLCLNTDSTSSANWFIGGGNAHQQGAFSINLVSGAIYKNSNLLKMGTFNLSDFEIYKKIYKDKNFPHYTVGEIIHFTDDKGWKIRVGRNWRSEKALYATIGNTEYVYIFPKELSDTIPFLPLLEGVNHFLSLDKQQLLMFSPGNQRLLAEWNKGAPLTYHTINGPSQLLFDKPDEPLLFDALSFFEEANYLLWSSKEGKIEALTLPRYTSLNQEPLEFLVQKTTTYLTWKSNPRFYLAEKPLLLDNFTNFLFLSDKKNPDAGKILVPLRPLLQHTSLSTKTQLDLSNNADENTKEKESSCYASRLFLEYDVRQGKVIPLNLEGKLWLIQLYLLQRKSNEAFLLLQSLSTADIFSKTALSILEKLCFFSTTTGLCYPDALALQFQALLHKIHWINSPAGVKDPLTEEERKDLFQAWKSYLSVLNNVDRAYQLSASQEGEITEFLQLHEFSIAVKKEEKIKVPNLLLTNLVTSADICTYPRILRRLRDSQKTKDYYEKIRQASSPEQLFALSIEINFSLEDELQEHIDFQVVLQLALKAPQKAPPLPLNGDSPEWKEWSDAMYQLHKDLKKSENTFYFFEKGRKFLTSLMSYPLAAVEKAFESPTAPKKHTPLCLLSPIEPSARLISGPLSLEPLNEARFQPSSLQALGKEFFCSNGLKKAPEPDLTLLLQGKAQVVEKSFEKAIKAEFEAFLQDFEIGRSKRQKEKTFSFNANCRFQELKIKLEELSKIEKPLEELKEFILSWANRKNVKTPSEIVQQGALQEGKAAVEIPLSALITAFLKGDLGAYARLNPRLQLEEITQIDRLLQFYLMDSASLFQVKKSLSLLKKLDVAREDEETQRDLLEELEKTLSAGVHYDPSKARPLLVFEYQAEMRLRKTQVEFITQLMRLQPDSLSYQSSVSQLMMGGGKTTVIASILMTMTSSPDRLAIYSPPAAQFNTLRHNLHQSQSKNFLQEVIPLCLKRDELSVKNLRWTQQMLQQALHQESMILLSPETLQIFKLELLALLNELKEENIENLEKKKSAVIEKVALLHKILSIFQQKGNAVFDELDVLLNPLKEVNFPLGELNPLPNTHVDLLHFLFTLFFREDYTLSNGETLKKFMGLSENMQNYAIHSELYQQEVLPFIAREFFKHLEKELKLQAPHSLSFRRYILGEMSEQNNSVEDCAFLDHLKTLPPEKADQIVVLRHLLCDILPLTFIKKVRQSYGRDPQGTLGKVIPYLGVDKPARGTEFGNPYEAAIYQLLTACAEGITESQLISIAQKFKESAEHFSKTEKIPYDETEEFRQFLTLTGISLAAMDLPENVTKATRAINADSAKILLMETETIHLNCGHYSRYVSSNAQNITAQLASIRGFTGTPWQISCYAETLRQNLYLEPGVEGGLASLLLEKERENPDIFHVLEDVQNIPHILKSAPHARGIIDTAGIFHKKTNQAVAEEVLNYFKLEATVQAVLYFDESNHLLALKKGSPLPVMVGGTTPEDLEKAGIDLEKFFVYYDECHTEATNIGQNPKATNLLTIDEKIIARTLFQGAMRLRKLFSSQTIEYVLAQNTLHYLPEKRPSVSSIILLASKNQALRKAKETFRSYLQKIDHTLQQACFDELLKAGERLPSLLKIFIKYETLFIQQSGLPSFAANGMPAGTEEALIQLERHIERRVSAFRALNPEECILQHVTQNLDHLLVSAKKEICLPSHVEKTQNLLLEKQQELAVQKEVALTQEIELEQELSQELDLYLQDGKFSFPFKEMPWTDETISSKDFLKTHSVSLQGEPHLHTLIDLFKAFPYKQPYADLFDTSLLVTTNFAYTRSSLHAIFHRRQKMAYQILFVHEAEALKGILLSLEEAAYFKAYLEKMPSEKMWLSLHDKTSISESSAHLLPPHLKQREKEIFWQVNFLNGHIPYLLEEDEMTEAQLEKMGPLAIRFLKLKVEKSKEHRHLFYKNPLFLHKEGVQEERYFECLERKRKNVIVKETLLRMSPQEIGLLSDAIFIPFLSCHQVPHLTNPLLIQRLRPKQLAWLKPSQVSLLTDPQLIWLDTPDLINAVKEEKWGLLTPIQKQLFNEAHVKKLKPQDYGCLTPLQAGWLEAESVNSWPEKLFASMPPKAVQFLADKSKLAALTTKAQIAAVANEDLSYLIPKQYGLLSESQVAIVSELPTFQRPQVSLLDTRSVGSIKRKELLAEIEDKYLKRSQLKIKYADQSKIALLLTGLIFNVARLMAFVSGLYFLRRLSFIHRALSLLDQGGAKLMLFFKIIVP